MGKATIYMLNDTIRTFLEKPLIARMSTIDPDGFPHTVPVWFALDGNDLVAIAVRSTRKVQHILINPKGAMVIGGEDEDAGGYMFQGVFTIEDDPGDVWMNRLITRYEDGAQAARDSAEWADLDIVVLRLTPHKVLKVSG